MIAGCATPTVKEGDWDGNPAAILRFPSLEAAENGTIRKNTNH